MERRLRLREEWALRAARSKGRAVADGPLVLRVRAVKADPPAANRYAVVAGKKVGGAVQRNRLKRLVREALRHLHPALAPGHDLVVIVRGGVEELPDYATARATLERIVRRAGLMGRETRTGSPLGRGVEESGRTGGGKTARRQDGEAHRPVGDSGGDPDASLPRPPNPSP